MDFDVVLKLPLKRFWFLVNQIDRLRAEQDLRQIQLLGSSGSEESLKAAIESLKDQQGQIYVWQENAPAEIRLDDITGLDPEFDRAGLRALKGLSELREGHAI